MSSQAVVLILEKIASKDKDFRYMATSDLLNELQKDSFKVDADMERKLCTVILTQLDDASGDISGLAVKCLGLLVRKVAEARAEELVRNLCDKAVTVVAKKEQARDIASIGLKTIIAEIPGGHLAQNAATTITNKMLDAAAKDNADVVNDALDILGDVLTKFGGYLGAEHARIKAALVPLLDDQRAPVRKRALHCLACVSMFLGDELLGDVITGLLTRLKAGDLKAEVVRTYIQAVGAVSRAVGYRFGRYLNDAVPLVVRHCDQAGEGDDELREYCLQALESFLQRAPHDARGHVDTVLTCALKCLKYDPNFADDEDGMEEDGDEEDEEEEEEAGSDDDAYSDDEDQSWKVRRAAAKVLAAAALACTDSTGGVYGRTAGDLVARFKEREENVRADVFAAFVTLARQVGAGSRRYDSKDPASPLVKLEGDVPLVLKALSRTLKGKSPKARAAAFSLLRELAGVAPRAVADQLALLVPGITAALADKSSTASSLKIEALLFTRQVLAAGPQGQAATGDAGRVGHIKALAKAVLPCAAERYYKMVSEALHVIEQLVYVLRPAGGAPAPLPGDLAPLVPQLFSALQAKLSAQDQDQEVKDAAISAASAAVSQLGDVLKAEVPGVLRTLLDRMRNEITRLAAVRAYASIAQSPQTVDLAGAGVLEPAVAELTSFLRKALRPLRVTSLGALEALVGRHGSQLSSQAAGSLTEEAAAVLAGGESDLPLAALALRVLATLVRTAPASAPGVADKCVPAALELVRSPLLQGAALEALQAFFAALAASGAPTASPDRLLQQLLDAGHGASGSATADANTRAAQPAVAQCIAVLACTAGAPKVEETVTRLLGAVGRGDVKAQRLALLALGEIGRRTDLSTLPQVESAISSSLGSDSEEVKGAASLALGGITLGNLPRYMPSLIQQISGSAGNAKAQYLLLTALSEVISTISAYTFAQPKQGAAAAAANGQAPQLSEGQEGEVLRLLLASAVGPGSQEECRTVVSECLGHLALLHPGPVLDQLEARLKDPSPDMRGVVVSAIKYAVVDRPHPVDSHLAAHLLAFLSLMSDEDRHVRRASVVSLAAVAHQKAGLVAQTGVLGTIMPLLYAQTVVRQDLIRTVDLGPFKHKIDDGLELRKAAFECLDILIDAPPCRSQLDTPTLITQLQSGLGDHLDVVTTCHLMVSKLSSVDPSSLLAGADRLVEPLEKTLTTKLKGDAVKQEVDRHEDMIRSCLRAVDALAQLPGIGACAPFQSLMRKVVKVPPIKDKYEQIERERLEAEGAGAMDIDS